MFMGEYNHTLDTKGRLIIPSRYREALGDQFVVTKGLDGCLFVYPNAEWDAFEEKLKEVLAAHGIGLIVLAGFMTILTADFTACYPQRIINVHPSLIPSFCGEGFYGLRVHQAALDYGVKVTGATVHFVNEIPDGGKIIAQKAVYIADGDTPETLQRRVMEQAEWVLLPQAAEQVSAALQKA